MLKDKTLGPSVIPPDIRAEVLRYSEWLNRQSEQANDTKERREYALSAKQAVKVGDKTIVPFVPFHKDRSALKTITMPQGATFTLLGLLVAGALFLWHWQALSVIIGAIVVFYLFLWLLNVYALLRAKRLSPSANIDQCLLDYLAYSPWPTYTILCPLYKEGPVVAQFIKAMAGLDYPTSCLQILLLTEEDDNETRMAIATLGSLPPHFRVVTVPRGEPRTKPRACNYGLILATGRYVVIYDAEDVPEATQLKKAVLTFAQRGPELACVQAQLNFYNTHQNFLTRLFTIEYSLWFDHMLPGLQHMNMAMPLGGTSNHFRTSVLRALGGWDGFNVTEDADLGMRLSHYHFQTAMLESTTYEEANPNLKNWIRQRSRWIKGYMQTYLVHMRHPLRDLVKGRGSAVFSIQTLVGGASVTFLINPLMWAMVVIYALFRGDVEGIYHILFPAPILYASMLCLVFGNFYYLYIAMIACVQRKQYALVLFCLLLPFYWVLLSVAAIKAAWQLITKPHYWEKTQHGLHLKNKQAAQEMLAVTGHGQLQEANNTIFANPSDPGISPASAAGSAGSLTEAIKAITTLPLPAVSVGYKKAKTRSQQARVRDLWLWAVGIVGTICSIAATIYYYQGRQLLVYADAYSHLSIARRVIFGATPGLAQLGVAWLPLQHLLMQLFIWNDFLWRTGLAGSLISMPCYVASAIFIYLSALKLGCRNGVAFLAACVFLFNPNILYLQTTPLSELLCILGFVASCYYFSVWTQENEFSALIVCGICVFLTTITRYDGWILCVSIFAAIVGIDVLRRKNFSVLLADITLYCSPAIFGILLWFGWCQAIVGDALYFKNGPFSAHKQQLDYLSKGLLFTNHDLYQSLRFFTLDTLETVGLALFVATLVGLALYLLANITNRFSEKILIALIFFSPFIFYVYALYAGIGIMFVPGAVPADAPQLFNVRYAAQVVPSLAIFLALGIGVISTRLKGFVFSALCLLCLGLGNCPKCFAFSARYNISAGWSIWYILHP